MKPRAFVQLSKETAFEWSRDNASDLSAALAYYTVFSIAPLLVILMAIASFVLRGQEGRLMDQIGSFLGPQMASTMQGILENAQRPGSGIIAGIIGVIVLIVGASGVFYQLHTSLNTIWDVQRKEGGGFMGVIRTRLSSFAIIFLIGLILLVAIAASAALSALGNVIGGGSGWVGYLLQVANFVLSFVIIGLLFAVIFKTLPDVEIRWSDVLIGAGVTSLLFVIGKLLIGLYLSKSTVASPYGAAGSLVILLAFVYYSAQVFFFGAEFTQIYANKFGSRIVPAREGEPMPGEEPSADRYPSEPGSDERGVRQREERRKGRAQAAGQARGEEREERRAVPGHAAAQPPGPDRHGEELEARPRWGVAFASFIGGILTGMFLRRPEKPA